MHGHRSTRELFACKLYQQAPVAIRQSCAFSPIARQPLPWSGAPSQACWAAAAAAAAAQAAPSMLE